MHIVGTVLAAAEHPQTHRTQRDGTAVLTPAASANTATAPVLPHPTAQNQPTAQNHPSAERNRPAQHTPLAVQIRPEDLRGAIRRGSESNLIVFAVDSSGSMAARDRLTAVTGAVLTMLRDAYQRRDKVAVVTFRGHGAEVVLPPTRSVDVAARRLADVPTGGRTPLAAGLAEALRLIQREHVREPGRRALLIVLSDGRATAAGGMNAAEHVARAVAGTPYVGSLVIDCERQGRIQLGLAKTVARHLHAPCVRLTELSADSLSSMIRIV